jgi:PAS domain S-box-containing protein
MKHTFSIGQPLSRQFGEAVKRTARALKWVGSTAEEVPGIHPVLATAPSPQDVEHRLAHHRPQWERRRSEGIAPVETPRVLLVEPDRDTRVLYASLFEEAGYAVYAMAEGIRAIDVARGRLPDVVVMDLAAPVTEGFEILRQWREDPLTSTIPIVVVTSLLQFDVPARTRALGAISVLERPMSPETILAEVDELIRATPRERLVVRQLRRSLLMLRELGKQVKPDERGQERIRSLIDRLQVAILALDTQGHYVAVSRGASTLTGYSRAELLGKSIYDEGLVLPPPVSERWQEFLTQQQAAAETIMRDSRGNSVSIQTEFATVLPGLHAAAFADQNAAQLPRIS